MVDDDGLRGHQECMQALRDLGELHSLSLKDLQYETNINIARTVDIWTEPFGLYFKFRLHMCRL